MQDYVTVAFDGVDKHNIFGDVRRELAGMTGKLLSLLVQVIPGVNCTILARLAACANTKWHGRTTRRLSSFGEPFLACALLH